MDESLIRGSVLKGYGLRMRDEMARYVLGRLASRGTATGSIPVMGCDARTGVPLRRMVELPGLVDRAGSAQSQDPQG